METAVKYTTEMQLTEAKKSLKSLMIDRLNQLVKVGVEQDILVSMDKNILGAQATIHALETLQKLGA